jgi:hypothetical protein
MRGFCYVFIALGNITPYWTIVLLTVQVIDINALIRFSRDHEAAAETLMPLVHAVQITHFRGKKGLILTRRPHRKKTGNHPNFSLPAGFQ